MRVFVPQHEATGIINGAHPKVISQYDGITIEFKGHSKSIGACGVTVEMSAHQAITLAIELIHKANKHADDLHGNTANALKRLSRKYVKE